MQNNIWATTPRANAGLREANDGRYYGGTWTRNDPNDGTRHAHANPPTNGKYWCPNGLGVTVGCERAAASYVVQ